MTVPPAGLRMPPAPAPPGAGPPPLRVPAQHFVAALGFFVLGAAGLTAAAPDLAAGRFLAPRVVATAHLFTLGWVTLSIFAALYQFLPVALGVPIRWLRLTDVTFALTVGGLSAFAGGLAFGSTSVLVPGAAALSLGLVLFAGNLLGTLLRARARDLTWWSLLGAAGFLLATVAFGFALAGSLRWGWVAERRLLALGVHLHVAVAGWVLLVVAGVARRLLPMFLLSHGAGERAMTAAAALFGAGAGLLALLHHFPGPLVFGAAAVLLTGGVAALAVQAALYFRHRRRPALDPGLRLAGGALALLVGAAALGAAALVPPAVFGATLSARLATAYGAALVPGALALFVAGNHYKILPFLVWYHRFGPLAGERPVPGVTALYRRRTAGLAAALLGAGAVGLTVAVLAGAATAAAAAGWAYLCGALLMAGQMAGLLGRRD